MTDATSPPSVRLSRDTGRAILVSGRPTISFHVEGQPNDELIDLAFELSKRAVDSQQSVLAETRARAGTLLTATSVVVSFLGAQALGRLGFNTLAALALISFLASVVGSLVVLWPQRDAWKFRLDSRVLLADFVDRSEPNAKRSVAIWMQEHYDDNQLKLEQLLRVYRFAVAMLAVQALLWAIDLTS